MVQHVKGGGKVISEFPGREPGGGALAIGRAALLFFGEIRPQRKLGVMGRFVRLAEGILLPMYF